MRLIAGLVVFVAIVLPGTFLLEHAPLLIVVALVLGLWGWHLRRSDV